MEKRTKKFEEVIKTRLNKFISHNSKYSRREADRLIADGKVKINKITVEDMGSGVDVDNDVVTVNDKTIRIEKDKMYTVIVYNKPKGELVTKNDPRERRIIYDTLGKKYLHFRPVGRLDYASEGVLLLSDSIEIVDGLMHSNLERTYKIKVNGPINKSMEMAMQEGLDLEDASVGGHSKSKITSMYFKPFVAYDILTNGDKFSKIKVIISEGKNRELRRFFAHFGLDIMDLKRVDFGGISLNNLPTGKSRFLSKEEYTNLRSYLKQEND
ncbi:MAG: rRNA pseudouridine synthase [Campylobacteraceae bacterium]|nr:rRNA pseudouridine synthase [Campylobacteraceae bacterium]